VVRRKANRMVDQMEADTNNSGRSARLLSEDKILVQR